MSILENPAPASAAPSPSPRADAAGLRPRALLALCEPEAQAKVEATRALHAALRAGALRIDPETRAHALNPPGPVPGRPAKPRLVDPRAVPMRSPNTAAGRAALLHAIAHIEFNAINLALDAIWRFDGLPEAYYRDWLQVAVEEAHHHSLLANHLAGLGCRYGDFEAHDGLWQMCESTASDVLARMAIVPRTLEARGLDASPAIRAKLAAAGDHDAAAILDTILRDEVGHVAIGNQWFRWLCDRDGLDPRAVHERLAEQHRAPQPRPPLNRAARLAAGFSAEELDDLERRARAVGPQAGP